MMAMRLARAEATAEDQTLNRETVARVWTFAHPFRRPLIGYVVTLAFGAAVGLVPSLVFRQLLDQSIPQRNTDQLLWLSGLVLAVAVAAALIALVERWLSAVIGEGLILDLRTALFSKVQQMPIGFFARTQTGALTHRLNHDVIGAQRALTGTLGSTVSNVIVLMTTIPALIALDWRLTAAALILLPLFLIPARRVGRRLADLTRDGMDLNAKMNASITERFSVGGALLVKLFGRYGKEQSEFTSSAAKVRDIGIVSAMAVRRFTILLELMSSVAIALVFGFGGWSVINGDITLGTLAALTMLIPRVYQPLISLTTMRVDLVSAMVSFERVFEVLDAPNLIEDQPDALAVPRPRGRVTLDRVSFTYPGKEAAVLPGLEVAGPEPKSGRVVIDEVSVDIEPGATVALVGPSGAGKSTLISLIPRLWDVTGGAIRVDGHDVREVTQESLRRFIGFVPQDAHLFHVSIGENLRYAKPEATDDDLWAACEAAQVAQVIRDLPEGFDTIVGERGYRMSGGEKQRLAIARMLLKDPAIVLLDEATAHLDTESEALVQAALSQALQGRTALVIAHRLSTIVDADLILVLDDGKVVERGTHTELLDAGSLYSDLYKNLVRGERSQPELAAL